MARTAFRWWSPVALLAAFAGPVWAQVDCGDPDNLCTGDPCVIPALELEAGCNVDFGTREVVVSDALRLANGVTFHAGRIEVQGKLVGGGYLTFGAHVTLAADGDLVVSGGVSRVGQINLSAGDDLVIEARLITLQFYLDAGGDVTVSGVLTGPPLGYFNFVQLDAGGDVDLQKSIILQPSTGQQQGQGGSLNVNAAGLVTLRRRVRATGPGQFGEGGQVTLSGGNGVHVESTARLLLGGGGIGGNAAFTSASGNVTLLGDIDVHGGGFGYGQVSVVGNNVQVVSRRISADGGRQGGNIELHAVAGNLSMAGNFRARSGTRNGGPVAGATIEATATGDLTAAGIFEAAPTGCIALSAGGNLDTSGATFDVPPMASCP